MFLRRVAFKPLCRQCGFKFERPTARCPMCGLRTGYVEPLRSPVGQGVDNRRANAAIVTDADFDEDIDDMVLAPPVERTAEPPVSIEMYREREEEEAAPPEKPAPVARRVSLSGLILGTTLVAVCLGLGRVSLAWGIIAFLVLIPAYVRTLSAISYFRDHGRELGRDDIGGIFTTSFVLSLMGLAAAGMVFVLAKGLCGWVLGFFSWEQPFPVATVLGTVAAFVTVFVLVHWVWPVNRD